MTIAPAFVSLTGSGLAATSALVVDKVARVTLDVTNDGNVTARGRTTVVLYLSPDQTVADGTQVGDVPLTVGLAPGKSHAGPLSFTLPSSLAAGAYDLLAVIDPADSLGTTGVTDTTGGALVVGATVDVT